MRSWRPRSPPEPVPQRSGSRRPSREAAGDRPGGGRSARPLRRSGRPSPRDGPGCALLPSTAAGRAALGALRRLWSLAWGFIPPFFIIFNFSAASREVLGVLPAGAFACLREAARAPCAGQQGGGRAGLVIYNLLNSYI